MKLQLALSCSLLLCGTALLGACGGSDDDDGGVAGRGTGAAASSGGTSSGAGGSDGSGVGTSAGKGGTTSAGGNGGSGTCSPTDPTGGSNDCPAWTECAQTSCDAEYKECLGSSYESGDFSGGACEAWMNCNAACGECDTECHQGCFAQHGGGACSQCFTDLGTCTTGACSAELEQCSNAGGGGTSGTGGTGSASTGKTCADLEACCAGASGDQATQCTQTYDAVKAGGDAACDAAYQIFKASMVCE